MSLLKNLKECLEKTEADIKEIDRAVKNTKLEQNMLLHLKELKWRYSYIFYKISNELAFLEAIKEKGFLKQNQNSKVIQQVKEAPSNTQVKENPPIEINYNEYSIKIFV